MGNNITPNYFVGEEFYSLPYDEFMTVRGIYIRYEGSGDNYLYSVENEGSWDILEDCSMLKGAIYERVVDSIHGRCPNCGKDADLSVVYALDHYKYRLNCCYSNSPHRNEEDFVLFSNLMAENNKNKDIEAGKEVLGE